MCPGAPSLVHGTLTHCGLESSQMSVTLRAPRLGLSRFAWSPCAATNTEVRIQRLQHLCPTDNTGLTPADHAPYAQVLVNGEITITAVGSSTHSLHTSPGSGSNVASASRALAASSLGSLSQLSLSSAHSESGVTGLTGHDVISLGPRAKISVTYQGDERGEGFLSLRKL